MDVDLHNTSVEHDSWRSWPMVSCVLLKGSYLIQHMVKTLTHSVLTFHFNYTKAGSSDLIYTLI